MGVGVCVCVCGCWCALACDFVWVGELSGYMTWLATHMFACAVGFHLVSGLTFS